MSVSEPALAGTKAPAMQARLDSYTRLADVFHEVLSEQSREAVLERIADTLADLVPYDTLTIYEARESERVLIPVLARDQWAEEILKSHAVFGQGVTGWAGEHKQPVLANKAHLDPRVVVVPGTPLEPEALISVPLVARGSVKGALNIYRLGEDGVFSDEDFDLAKRFGDAAALALDNATSRAALEQQAKTDSLTGLYNHRFFHERLRAELSRASRSHDAVAVVMLDIDDFKRLNDVYGHAVGDGVLVMLAEIFTSSVRASDVVCRLGGEEFAVIMPSCDAGDALGLAGRLNDRIRNTDFDPADRVTISIGISQGPDHAMNPRELVACAEAAMMTAKANGKDRTVLFDDRSTQRPEGTHIGTDVRSIAHLKMLQNVARKLNRLNDVAGIANSIADELRTLVDYHRCIVWSVDDDFLRPIASKGDFSDLIEDRDDLGMKVGEGVVGRVAETARPLLVADASRSAHISLKSDGPAVERSVVAVPLTYGSRVIAVIGISKLGIGEFDDADVRLLEVLAGHAAVALENARLYEAERHEAENAKALLEFADSLSKAPSLIALGEETVRFAARLLGSGQASLWLQDDQTGDYECVSHCGYVGDPTAEPIIRTPISGDEGDRFIDGRADAFTMTPSGTDGYFKPIAGVVARTVAAAPLSGMQGWLTVREPSSDQSAFRRDHLRLLAGLSQQASMAIQKARLYKDQKENAEIANALLQFSRALATAEGIDEVLESIVDQAARILGSPKACVWIQDQESGDLIPRTWWGYTDTEIARLRQVALDSSAAKAILTAWDPFVFYMDDIAEVSRRPRDGDRGGDHEVMYAVAPMRLEGERLGAITCAAPALGDYEFSERKMRLLAGVAHQAQLAIANAGAFESLERTFLSTVEALANALEAKDEYTSSHARWISDMSLKVGRELRLDAKALKRLELGALFHDIGKIGIPSSILLKPGALTDEEWAIIKTHPELGEKILSPIDRLADVRRIVRHCHEHYDGGGYPDGKAGGDIPIESRIILVVDAFHAMTSNRSYRDALPLEEAYRRLRLSSGTQFDPDVVEAFLDALEGQPAAA